MPVLINLGPDQRPLITALVATAIILPKMETGGCIEAIYEAFPFCPPDKPIPQDIPPLGGPERQLGDRGWPGVRLGFSSPGSASHPFLPGEGGSSCGGGHGPVVFPSEGRLVRLTQDTRAAENAVADRKTDDDDDEGKQSQLCAMAFILVAGPSKLGRQYYQWPVGSKCGLEGNKASSVACMGALRQIGGAISWWASPKDSTPTIVKSKISEPMASR